MSISPFTRLLAITTAALLLSACSNTTLTSNWRNPDASSPPLKKVAVFVLAKDEAIRRYAEGQVMEKLPKDIVSTPGYTLFDKPEGNKDKVREFLIKEGYDGVLVSRLVSNETIEKYVPPQTIVMSTPNYGYSSYGGTHGYNYGSFNGYYGSAFNSTYSTTTEGYTVSNTLVVVETMLFRLPDGMLLWTGTTDTFNPDSKPEMVRSISDIIGAQVNQKGLLGGSR